MLKSENSSNSLFICFECELLNLFKTLFVTGFTTLLGCNFDELKLVLYVI